MPLAWKSPYHRITAQRFALGSEEVWLGTLGWRPPELRRQGHSQSTQLPATGERVLATAQRRSPARNISRADTFMTWTRLQNTGRCMALLSTAQLDITCSPRGCHLESGKPIYFHPRIDLVVLVRCRKPINHQRSLGVSISQEACHLRALIHMKGRRGRGGARRGGAAARDTWCEPGLRVCKCSQLRGAAGRTQASSLSARASFRFEVGAGGLGDWSSTKQVFQPGAFNIHLTSFLQLLWEE